jgi:hypothetical protein
MFMPPPAIVDPVAATELRPRLAADEEVVEVEPPLTEVVFCAGDGDLVAICWPKLHIRKPI